MERLADMGIIEELQNLSSKTSSDFDVKKHEEFYKTDILKVEVDIEDGLKHGLYKQYYEDGSIMLRGHFDEDLKDGTWHQ